jgi:hypothetical protein
VQYPETREPGFHLDVEHIEGYPDNDINCLLLYGMDRKLVGILNYYPQGFPGLEVPRAINIWVDPARQKRGIGIKMLTEFERRFGPIDWDAQRVTEAGLRLAEKYRAARTEG